MPLPQFMRCKGFVFLGLLTAVGDVFRRFPPSVRPNAHAVYFQKTKRPSVNFLRSSPFQTSVRFDATRHFDVKNAAYYPRLNPLPPSSSFVSQSLPLSLSLSGCQIHVNVQAAATKSVLYDPCPWGLHTRQFVWIVSAFMSKLLSVSSGWRISWTELSLQQALLSLRIFEKIR
jgi:hypothetical protein